MEGDMNRELARKAVLIIVGLLFVAGIYPIVMYLWRPGNEAPGDSMMLSLYVTLGVFLLVAARNPATYRSVIAYGAWANFAHGAVMLVMAVRVRRDRNDFLMASAIVVAIGIALLLATPVKPRVEQGSPGSLAKASFS
jgi:uncharacterized membrane protein HdeD (DUF308 family)